MIQNDKQLKLTEEWLASFIEAHQVLIDAEKYITEWPATFVNRVQIAAVESIISELDFQVDAYKNKETD